MLEQLKEIDDCIDCDEVVRRLDSLENLINLNKERFDSLEKSNALIYFNDERIDRLEKLHYKRYRNVSKYLPLNLYFHNDQPNPRSLETSTNKSYEEVYISYYKMKDEYRQYDPNLDSFFEDSLSGNFNKLNIIFTQILSDLKRGKKIQLDIKGHASPLHENEYNINLSKRRVKSFVNFLELHQDGAFAPYLEDGYFQIVELSFGENNADNSVSDNPDDKQKSVFSLDAMLERRIEIIDIKLVQ